MAQAQQLSGQVAVSLLNEGAAGSSSIGIAVFTDTNTSDTAANFTATIDWGDGTTTSGTVTSIGTGSFQVIGNHAPADEGSDQVVVTITRTTDNDQIAPTGIVTIVEADNLSASGVSFNAIAGVVQTNLVANVTDIRQDAVPSDFTATISWGDGTTTTGTVTGIDGIFQVLGNHNYTSVGADNVTVDVADDSPGTATATATTTANVTQPLSGLRAERKIEGVVGR